jgi:Uma2 family endonuclease
MATTPALMTIEQYLRTSFNPDVDFVDGEIEERYLGEKDHGRAQGYVYAWFLAREASFSLEPILEQRMLVGPNRARVCDVAIIRQDIPDEQVARTPPFICVEVMSPEDRLSRVIKVLTDYRSLGVKHIWLIDPQEHLVYTFSAEGLQQHENFMLCAPEADIEFSAADLFADLEKRRRQERHD